MKYANVVLGLPIDKFFSYRIPKSIEEKVVVGKRVRIPFGRRNMIGYIIGIENEEEFLSRPGHVFDKNKIKAIQEIVDEGPIISEELLKLTKWISSYYLCSWGEAIEATIPGVLRKGKTSIKPKKPFLEEDFISTFDLSPTTEQRFALKLIRKSLAQDEHSVFLLHGITASGKTEVYLQAINYASSQNKSSIVLVPEISLTPQTVERFKSRFGEKVAIVHSRLTGSMRFREWQRIKSGEASIVVGVRSAVFSPVQNLGLVIVDEEHETSYKQEDVPRYHARDVAIERARINDAVVVLGSATPSLESFYNAEKGKFRLIQMTKRVEEKNLPEVKIVDMRKEFAARSPQVIFSRLLKDSMEKALKRKQQAMLFLNRRGFSTSVICKKCGLVARCKRCDSVLVYHFSDKKLICHYCNWKSETPDICPRCRSNYMRFQGLGTEKVESELHRYFPAQKMGRMDTDSMQKSGSHDVILKTFSKHGIDVLVGTQMIAKGLDFPKVTLVGVVSADTTLNLPDFRASERTFNLLTQVAGRAGRGDEKGLVIIQTYSPTHYAITTASKHNYESFYRKEIAYRQELNLPPFVHLTKLILRSKNNQRVEEASTALAGLLKKKLPRDVKIAGPTPALISRLRGQFRWNILLKVKNPEKINTLLKEALDGFKKHPGVFISVDVDPISV